MPFLLILETPRDAQVPADAKSSKLYYLLLRAPALASLRPVAAIGDRGKPRRRATGKTRRLQHGRDRRERAQAGLRSRTQALHLHRRARTAARVDPQLRDERARATRGGVGGDDVPRLGLPPH